MSLYPALILCCANSAIRSSRNATQVVLHLREWGSLSRLQMLSALRQELFVKAYGQEAVRCWPTESRHKLHKHRLANDLQQHFACGAGKFSKSVLTRMLKYCRRERHPLEASAFWRCVCCSGSRKACRGASAVKHKVLLWRLGTSCWRDPFLGSRSRLAPILFARCRRHILGSGAFPARAAERSAARTTAAPHEGTTGVK